MSAVANQARIAAMTPKDIDGVMERTALYAQKMIFSHSWRTGSGGLLPDGGSAEDLAQTAFENIIEGGAWDPSKPLWLVMNGYIRGRVGNLAKSLENKNTSSLDDKSADGEDGRSVVDQIATDDLHPVEKIRRHEEEERIRKIVDGLKEGSPERRILESILKGECKRGDILTDTGLDEKEYEAAKKRLRILLKKYQQ